MWKTIQSATSSANRQVNIKDCEASSPEELNGCYSHLKHQNNYIIAKLAILPGDTPFKISAQGVCLGLPRVNERKSAVSDNIPGIFF